MDTADEFNERAKRDMQVIKDRLSSVKNQMGRGSRVVLGTGAFTFDQMGLKPVMVDQDGKLWAVLNDRLVRVGIE